MLGDVHDVVEVRGFVDHAPQGIPDDGDDGEHDDGRELQHYDAGHQGGIWRRDPTPAMFRGGVLASRPGGLCLRGNDECRLG